MYVCLWPYTENLNLTNGNEGILTLHTCSIYSSNSNSNIQCKLTWWNPHYGKLKDSLSLNNQYASRKRWVGTRQACCLSCQDVKLILQSKGKLSLLPFMPRCQAYLTVNVATATNHSLASSSPPVTLYVAAVHVTSKSLNSIQPQTTWIQVQCH